MAVSRRPRGTAGSEIWPGFVDALSAMLLVIIFLLVVFVLAQFFLSEALSGRDQALARLNQQVNELSELLALERRDNADLRLNVAQLSASLQTSTEERDELVLRLDAEAARAAAAEAALAGARQVAEADRDTITMQLATIEVLRRDVVALRQVRDDLEVEVGQLLAALETIKAEASELTDRATTLENERERLAAALARAEADTEDLAARLKRNDALTTVLRDRTRELLARLATEEESRKAAEERTALAQRELETREIRLAELQALHLSAGQALEAEQAVSAAAKAQVALLNRQIEALRAQLARISQALNAAEAEDSEQNIVIANLGRRLNLALAQKVEELSRYRSEFFGRLREALGDRPDIRIVGDRFVFQSEVLFESASAALGRGGPGEPVAAGHDAVGDQRPHPRGSALDPARRWPHRSHSHRHGRVPVQLGTGDRARDLGRQIPDRGRHSAAPTGGDRLRRASADRSRRRRGRLWPQPAHRDQAD